MLGVFLFAAANAAAVVASRRARSGAGTAEGPSQQWQTQRLQRLQQERQQQEQLKQEKQRLQYQEQEQQRLKRQQQELRKRQKADEDAAAADADAAARWFKLTVQSIGRAVDRELVLFGEEMEMLLQNWDAFLDFFLEDINIKHTSFTGQIILAFARPCRKSCRLPRRFPWRVWSAQLFLLACGVPEFRYVTITLLTTTSLVMIGL